MTDAQQLERTLVLVKPDGVARGLVGEVLGRIERKGYRLEAIELRTATRELLAEHYHEHRRKPFFEPLVEFMLSGPIIAVVASFLAEHRVPLVVDPVMIATSGARLLQPEAVEALVTSLLPLATVMTPNLDEAIVLAGGPGSRRELAERIHALGPAAVIVTGAPGVHSAA